MSYLTTELLTSLFQGGAATNEFLHREVQNTMATIGILGGFGGYATADFFRRLLDTLKGETERDYPRMILDNDFSMPSRTRALLTGEGREEILDHMTHSIKLLLAEGADAIVLVCGTAHAFLPEVYARVPEARGRVLNLLTTLGEALAQQNVPSVLALAAEGALKTHLYRDGLAPFKIRVKEPDASDYEAIRAHIEAVKRNEIRKSEAVELAALLDRFGEQHVILGCTEFPALLRALAEMDAARPLRAYRFYDPLETALKALAARFARKDLLSLRYEKKLHTPGADLCAQGRGGGTASSCSLKSRAPATIDASFAPTR